MSDQTRHLTVAELQAELAHISRSADQIQEFAGMYGQVYADDLSEEIALGLRAMAETVLRLAGDHEVAHQRDAAFADAVQTTLDRLPVAGDLLAEPPAFAGPEPQTDREDRTADDHDRWLDDWRRAVEEDDK